MDVSLRKLWELVKDREAGVLQAMGLQSVHKWVTEQQMMDSYYFKEGTDLSFWWENESFYVNVMVIGREVC